MGDFAIAKSTPWESTNTRGFDALDASSGRGHMSEAWATSRINQFCIHLLFDAERIEIVDNKKHLEPDGPFKGLWVRTAKALRKGGYTSRDEVLDDVTSGRLHPYLSIHDYGRKADAEVRRWLGVRTWDECYRNVSSAEIFNKVCRNPRG